MILCLRKEAKRRFKCPDLGSPRRVGDFSAFAPELPALLQRQIIDQPAAARIYHEDTHNLAEGAGALTLAALAKEQAQSTDARLVLSSAVATLTGALRRGHPRWQDAETELAP